MLNYTEIANNAQEKLNSYHNESRIWTLTDLSRFRILRKSMAAYLRNISNWLEPIPSQSIKLKRSN